MEKNMRLFSFFTFLLVGTFLVTPYSAYATSGPVGLNSVRTASGPGVGQITLNWSRYSPEVTSYIIFYGTKSGDYQYATIDIGNNVVETIGYLKPGVRYYFLIQGYAQGDPLPIVSPEVSEIASSSQTTVIGTAGPFGLRSLTAVSGPASGQVTLKWQTITADTTSFSVVYGTKPGIYTFGALNVAGDTSFGATNTFTVGALNPGQRYYFAVIPQGGAKINSSAEVSQVAHR